MRLALLGSPVAHSLSPAMHRAAMAHANLTGDYEARDVDRAGFSASLGEIRSRILAGANVTMPHKQTANESCDRSSDRAMRVGAVNTLVLKDGELYGDNTDIDGVRAAWATGNLPDEWPVVILGAGGAAGAALLATRDRPQYVVARRPQQAGALIERIGVDATVMSWGPRIPRGVIVNATSLGMRGETLPGHVLERARGLLDMAYGEGTTPAVATLRDRGIPVADGLDMLVGQAVRSFAIWTGIEVESSVFRRGAAEELLKRSQSGTRVVE